MMRNFVLSTGEIPKGVPEEDESTSSEDDEEPTAWTEDRNVPRRVRFKKV